MLSESAKTDSLLVVAVVVASVVVVAAAVVVAAVVVTAAVVTAVVTAIVVAGAAVVTEGVTPPEVAAQPNTVETKFRSRTTLTATGAGFISTTPDRRRPQYGESCEGGGGG